MSRLAVEGLKRMLGIEGSSSRRKDDCRGSEIEGIETNQEKEYSIEPFLSILSLPTVSISSCWRPAFPYGL